MQKNTNYLSHVTCQSPVTCHILRKLKILALKIQISASFLKVEQNPRMTSEKIHFSRTSCRDFVFRTSWWPLSGDIFEKLEILAWIAPLKVQILASFLKLRQNPRMMSEKNGFFRDSCSNFKNEAEIWIFDTALFLWHWHFSQNKTTV